MSASEQMKDHNFRFCLITGEFFTVTFLNAQKVKALTKIHKLSEAYYNFTYIKSITADNVSVQH